MTYWITSETASKDREVILWKNGAYGKARHDIEETLIKELQFRSLDLFTYGWDDEPQESLARHFAALFAGVKKGDIVFIQWIILASNVYREFFFKQAKISGAKVVVIIHDLGYWITSDEQASERAVLNRHPDIAYILEADAIITHSDAMSKKLVHDFQLLNAEKIPYMVPLEVFGFRTFKGSRNSRVLQKTIDYVGNLHKSSFIKGMTDDFEINVYGPNPEQHGLTDIELENIHFKGSFDHEALPTMLEGSFGLVWASDTYPEKVGNDATYQRYNAPHKASLYLASDLPIIVSKDSALANFVERNQIGLVIDDLSQLNSCYDDLTEEKYGELLENTQRIGKLVRENFPIKRAIFKVLEKLEF